METWTLYAILAMVFAGITSVLAKFGLQSIHPDLALGIRTTVIFFLISLMVISSGKLKDLHSLQTKHVVLLIASGITTTLSWVFYYRAMKEGPVSYVASIDKASIIITLLLSFTLLKEPVTIKVLTGAALILLGMLVLVWK